MSTIKDRFGPAEGHSAVDYGRNAQPLPDLHIFSTLSELDESYSEDLARRRARQETIEREIAELAKRLSAPLETAAAPPHSRTDRSKKAGRE